MASTALLVVAATLLYAGLGVSGCGLHSLIVLAAAAACPSSADAINGGSSCACPLGSMCNATQCSSLSGQYTFPSSCASCACYIGLSQSTHYDVALLFVTIGLHSSYPTAPLVSSVYAPTYGSVWYIGSTYTVQWISASIPVIDVFLLVQQSSGGTFIPIMIAAAVPNTGSYQWLVSSNISTGANAYVVGIVPTGTTPTLPTNTLSPPFTIQSLPTGACPGGYASATGSYPGCSVCPQGSYSSVSLIAPHDSLSLVLAEQHGLPRMPHELHDSRFCL